MVLPENAKIKFRNMAREKKLFPASWAGNNLQEKCENKISHCAKKKLFPAGRDSVGVSPMRKKNYSRRPADSRRPSRRRDCVKRVMTRFPTVLDGAGGAARLCWTAPAALLGCAGPRLRRFLAVLEEKQPWPKNTPKKKLFQTTKAADNLWCLVRK